uniref:PEP-CTERM/exosortase system-associated acyltransferase n=1 Tax=uncultured bacterium CSL11 TaxID=1091566 RepID=G4WVE3_9BACT|nr:PEP-CTERM/exosortase system-associated acyltransferase [uncultured bacterium CSL11]
MIVPDKPPQDLVANPRADPYVPNFSFARLPLGAKSPLSTQVFELRYEVYCLECGFLDPEDYRNGIESDEYDDRSAHFTAHNLDHEMVGSLRLVHAPDSRGFPFEEHCNVLFENVTLPPRDQCGEVSRLVVRKTYRRRAGDTLAGIPQEFLRADAAVVPDGRVPGERRSNRPELLMGLYREMYRYSVECGIRYWYAAMERSLARALARFQFAFVPIGPQVDYYGPVTPYLADLRELEKKLGENDPKLLTWFRGS